MPSKLWVEGSNPSSITKVKRDIKSLMSRFLFLEKYGFGSFSEEFRYRPFFKYGGIEV